MVGLCIYNCCQHSAQPKILYPFDPLEFETLVNSSLKFLCN